MSRYDTTTLIMPIRSIDSIERHRFIDAHELNSRAVIANRCAALRESRLAHARAVVRSWLGKLGGAL